MDLNSRLAQIDNELSFLMVILSESAVFESTQGGNDAASLALIRQKLDSEISGIRSNASQMARWKSESSLDDEIICLASERHAVMKHL